MNNNGKNRTCLNCKFEPDWSKPSGLEYPVRVGKCKWSGDIPVLPAVYSLIKKSVLRYSDDSGVMERCAAWTKK